MLDWFGVELVQCWTGPVLDWLGLNYLKRYLNSKRLKVDPLWVGIILQ